MRRIISASLSPNTEADDVWLALKTLFAPHTWKDGDAVHATEAWFEQKFPGFKATSFNSGRSALFEILRAFGIQKGDEVMVQAFTCVAVPNSVLWNRATPVFVDIDDSLNLDIRDAQKKLTKKTRAIIVQHTLGIPADMDAIIGFAKRHHLVLIEDCAHSLRATYKGKLVGSLGDAAFFSFGRDKVLSSVFGGMAIIRSNLISQITNLKKNHDILPYPTLFWIKQQLLHPIAFSLILPFYTVGVGKVLLYLLQRLRLLSFPVYPEEKKGMRPSDFPKKYPNALATLLVRQLSKLDSYIIRRQESARIYGEILRGKKNLQLSEHREGAIFLRYPVYVTDPSAFIRLAKKDNILLGNWYHNTIDPSGVDFQSIGYVVGTCPRAERAAAHIINVPTLLTHDELTRVINQFV